jgi:hypothetical protein
VEEGGTTDDDRITYGFRLVTSRKPAQSELDRVRKAYRQQLAQYKGNEVEANELIGAKRGTVANAPELAAWTMVANVLLNMDETISKE